jgi:hypothetical protein
MVYPAGGPDPRVKSSRRARVSLVVALLTRPPAGRARIEYLPDGSHPRAHSPSRGPSAAGPPRLAGTCRRPSWHRDATVDREPRPPHTLLSGMTLVSLAHPARGIVRVPGSDSDVRHLRCDPPRLRAGAGLAPVRNAVQYFSSYSSSTSPDTQSGSFRTRRAPADAWSPNGGDSAAEGARQEPWQRPEVQPTMQPYGRFGRGHRQDAGPRAP